MTRKGWPSISTVRPFLKSLVETVPAASTCSARRRVICEHTVDAAEWAALTWSTSLPVYTSCSCTYQDTAGTVIKQCKQDKRHAC